MYLFLVVLVLLSWFDNSELSPWTGNVSQSCVEGEYVGLSSRCIREV